MGEIPCCIFKYVFFKPTKLGKNQMILEMILMQMWMQVCVFFCMCSHTDQGNLKTSEESIVLFFIRKLAPLKNQIISLFYIYSNEFQMYYKESNEKIKITEMKLQEKDVNN